MGNTRLLTTGVFLATAAVSAQFATGAALQPPDRMPRVKPGPLLPSAGGLVLGKTTKPQLLARWGAASQCVVGSAPTCSWIVGIGRNALPRPGETADYISVTFDPTTRWARYLSLTTTSARKSRLRAWRMPEAIGIGSPFPAVRRAYPTVRWQSSTRANTSNWSVLAYEHVDGQYSLNFTFDRSTRKVSAGRVIHLQIALR